MNVIATVNTRQEERKMESWVREKEGEKKEERSS